MYVYSHVQAATVKVIEAIKASPVSVHSEVVVIMPSDTVTTENASATRLSTYHYH